ncbi:UvrB/UvrC motif-containing protein [Sphingomonas aliaeris]|uniref:UvrB/UvrC motif-containing protein n=2 Tax=Sphingomonas aliaeris TaxID=2759526 RepID=A0A974NXY2_9SPHN|nr:UvrB/UvrC motif-containing protein [Sphingomonas aliaeris]QQV78906.1 UvrB/UvrC motif-containing protein [Sphingomonas aliaeris]
MAETIEDVRLAMEAAADAQDFALAASLRDRISIMRGQAADADTGPIDPSGLTRQQPGKMGIGTSRQRVTPPPGWKPPPKPDLMTSGITRPRKRD